MRPRCPPRQIFEGAPGSPVETLPWLQRGNKEYNKAPERRWRCLSFMLTHVLLGGTLLALAGIHFVDKAPNPALAVFGAIVGMLLLVSALLDAMWRYRARAKERSGD